MDKKCENCRFCIYVKLMREKEGPYCEFRGEYIGDTILCSEWEAMIVPKTVTNADRIRAMTDEELAEWVVNVGRTFGEEYEGYASLLDWLKQEVSEWQGKP